MKDFGRKVVELRRKKDITQEQLSYSADIPLSQIGRIERGEVNTTISSVLAICNALHTHPKIIFDFKISGEEK